MVEKLRTDLDFVQIEDPNTYFANPIGGVRIALLGSYDQQECIAARKKLQGCLQL